MRIQDDAEAMEAIAYLKSKYSPDTVRKAYTAYSLSDNSEKFELCGDCDGCGWVEGGKTLKTICNKCNGTGVSKR